MHEFAIFGSHKVAKVLQEILYAEHHVIPVIVFWFGILDIRDKSAEEIVEMLCQPLVDLEVTIIKAFSWLLAIRQVLVMIEQIIVHGVSVFIV